MLNRHVDRLSKPQQHQETRNTLAPLKLRNIISTNKAPHRELDMTQASRGPQLRHVLPECPQDASPLCRVTAERPQRKGPTSPQPTRSLQLADRKSTRLNSSHLGISY